MIGLIDTATNTFVSYQEIGSFGGPVGPNGIAITPDGKTVFASTYIGLYAVDIATRAVKASTATGAYALAVTPDGKFLYGAGGSSPISVIDTANLSVTATISATLGSFPAITRSPDGSFVYVTGTNSVLVIDTSTNAVARSIPVTNAGSGIAVTPDGKHLYVTDGGSNNVSVIDTVSETVSTKVAAGSSPAGVGIVPAPQFGTAFPAFTISTLDITLKGAGGHFDKFTLKSEVYVGATGPSNPVYEPINFQIGPYSVTIPAGSFTQNGNTYRFDGVIDGVALSVTIKENGTLRYALDASASGLSLAGVANPVQVSLNDGGDGALTYATAHINHVP